MFQPRNTVDVARIADLRSKEITWSKEWIRKVAEAAERDPSV